MVRVRNIGIVVGAIIAASIGMVAPASGAYLCEGRLCGYDDLNYVGLLARAGTVNVIVNYSGTANDQLSSVRNETSKDGILYSDAGGLGATLCVDSNSNKGYVGAVWNDEVSSMKLRASNTIC